MSNDAFEAWWVSVFDGLTVGDVCAKTAIQAAFTAGARSTRGTDVCQECGDRSPATCGTCRAMGANPGTAVDGDWRAHRATAGTGTAK